MIRPMAILGGLVLTASLLAMGRSPAGQPAPPPPPQPAPAADDLNDVVHANNTSTANVKIVSDNWDGITVRIQGNNTLFFPTDTITGVEYAQRPAEYDTAATAKNAGQYAEAASLLEKALKGLKADALPQRQYFLTAVIECYEALMASQPDQQNQTREKLRAAAKAMVAIKPEPRLIYDAYLKLAESYLREGTPESFKTAEETYKAALKLFTEMGSRKEVSGKRGVERFIERYALMARLGTIRCAEALGRIDGAGGARSDYEVFPARAAGHNDLIGQAKLGYGRCLTARNPDEGISYFKNLLGKVPAGAVPDVYCALGDAYLAKAQSPKKDELDYYWARWYYLKVVVQYSAGRATLARAHFGAGQCYSALGADPKVRESGAAAKAVREFEAVVRDFPDSPEYALAKAQLEGKGKG